MKEITPQMLIDVLEEYEGYLPLSKENEPYNVILDGWFNLEELAQIMNAKISHN